MSKIPLQNPTATESMTQVLAAWVSLNNQRRAFLLDDVFTGSI
jgi:hypothetical protein